MSEQTDTITLPKWVLQEIHHVAERNKDAYYAECQKNKKLVTEFDEKIQELESQLAVALAERNQVDEANKRLSDSLETWKDRKEMFQYILNEGLLLTGVPKTLTASQMKEICDAVKDEWVCPLECDDELRDSLMDCINDVLEERFKTSSTRAMSSFNPR